MRVHFREQEHGEAERRSDRQEIKQVAGQTELIYTFQLRWNF